MLGPATGTLAEGAGGGRGVAPVTEVTTDELEVDVECMTRPLQHPNESNSLSMQVFPRESPHHHLPLRLTAFFTPPHLPQFLSQVWGRLPQTFLRWKVVGQFTNVFELLLELTETELVDCFEGRGEAITGAAFADVKVGVDRSFQDTAGGSWGLGVACSLQEREIRVTMRQCEDSLPHACLYA